MGHVEGRYKLTVHMERSKPTCDVTTDSLNTTPVQSNEEPKKARRFTLPSVDKELLKISSHSIIRQHK